MHVGNDIDWERADPLAVIELERAQQRKMCDDLERLADQLGGVLDVKLCAALKEQLQIDLPIYLQDEEALFELMRQTKRGDHFLTVCTRHAKAQHASMQGYVFEVLEPLDEISNGMSPRNLDAVGYMLRYCFDMMRHHMQWEDIVILRKQALDGLVPKLDHLRQVMQHNRRCAL
jgi:hypothetical protein